MSQALQLAYEHRYANALVPVARLLEDHIKGCLSGEERIDRIVARAKRVDRFLDKAIRQIDGSPKYNDPLNQIQDQLGARVVTYYLEDVERKSKVIEKYFHPVERKTIVPDSETEFGYFGKHLILLVPNDVLGDEEQRKLTPRFFELQIKTLFQHAWGEAEHDLGNKPEVQLTSQEKRKIAFTSAQAWGADLIFNELHLRVLGRTGKE